MHDGHVRPGQLLVGVSYADCPQIPEMRRAKNDDQEYDETNPRLDQRNTRPEIVFLRENSHGPYAFYRQKTPAC